MNKEKSYTSFEKFIIKLDKIMTSFESFVGVICFVIMTAIIMLGVISRYILHIPFMWTEEVARYLMITGVYIGISLATRERAHLGLTGVVDALPGKLKTFFTYLREIITIAAFAIFSFYAVEISITAMKMGQTSPALKLPMYVVYFPIVLGFILSTIRSGIMFWNDCIRKEKLLKNLDDEVWSG